MPASSSGSLSSPGQKFGIDKEVMTEVHKEKKDVVDQFHCQDQHSQDHGSLVGPKEFPDGNVLSEDDCSTLHAQGLVSIRLARHCPKQKRNSKRSELPLLFRLRLF
ncbi:hypothetical protein ZWY2020_005323 [Hordeum vulgare]|nr:hypothetical protein ZWY2020_005323 [Hordeum vulgare]